ncbi:hypothetical protein WOLCODRAFT_16003 [Wolfiporia cocos MD-104 SS10]|uniref:Uncharacterized protein n=1 Tax=Wolfiporia cocos (strain MD-104) TaxID=742152 RepID=A0A2H3JAQ2_WOLCO|nr:hypothetical protein WOLCODRAFT_16003 [Wolfiporia cocos MD-104 SS10]
MAWMCFGRIAEFEVVVVASGRRAAATVESSTQHQVEEGGYYKGACGNAEHLSTVGSGVEVRAGRYQRNKDRGRSLMRNDCRSQFEEHLSTNMALYSDDNTGQSNFQKPIVTAEPQIFGCRSVYAVAPVEGGNQNQYKMFDSAIESADRMLRCPEEYRTTESDIQKAKVPISASYGQFWYIVMPVIVARTACSFILPNNTEEFPSNTGVLDRTQSRSQATKRSIPAVKGCLDTGGTCEKALVSYANERGIAEEGQPSVYGHSAGIFS